MTIDVEALQALLDEIEVHQDLVDKYLNDYESTPFWRHFRRSSLFASACAHHNRAGDLLASLHRKDQT